MKIRLLLDSKSLGGVETHTINLCSELTALGHDSLIVFVRPYHGNILYNLCEKQNVNYVVHKTYSELISFLIKEKPDILHAHGYKANLLARFIGLRSHIPIVTTFHSGEKPVGRLILYNFLDRWSSFLSHNICVNRLIAQSLPSKSTVFPNFVDLPETTTRVNVKKPLQIYFIGRFSPEKGPMRFCQLSEQSPDFLEWHMVGNGPLLNTCQESYDKTVHFHGAILNMEDIWNQVDLLVITSTYEGLPLVLLEAMSRGIPVVSFNVGNIKDVISDKHYVVDDFDLNQMREIISSHFSKPFAERITMAEQARNKIDAHFSKRIVVPQIETFYQRIAKG